MGNGSSPFIRPSLLTKRQQSLHADSYRGEISCAILTNKRKKREAERLPKRSRLNH